jgi:Flp pilus assembly protein TadG
MKLPFVSLRRRSQKGQAATEFVIIGVVFLGMLSGLVEMTYVLRAKHLLNMATFDAVRTGSVNNAFMAPMELTLEQDMAALYMQSDASPTGLQAAITRAKNLYNTMKAAGKPSTRPLTVINPTQAMFNKFSETQFIRLSNKTAEASVPVIPNDNLQWRDRGTQSITVGGKAAAINLQDANLLKIRVYWCQHLVVPGLDVVVHSIAEMPTATPQQKMCDGIAQTQDNYYIAIESDAVTLMQDAVASDGTNLQ